MFDELQLYGTALVQHLTAANGRFMEDNLDRGFPDVGRAKVTLVRIPLSLSSLAALFRVCWRTIPPKARARLVLGQRLDGNLFRKISARSETRHVRVR